MHRALTLRSRLRSLLFDRHLKHIGIGGQFMRAGKRATGAHPPDPIPLDDKETPGTPIPGKVDDCALLNSAFGQIAGYPCMTAPFLPATRPPVVSQTGEWVTSISRCQRPQRT